ncbi:EF-Tu/IF-2/RF-3 family GTPase [Pseudactinotalea suaedae]|uniref:EF-Tu/IF-2/RF-3 family GTPase n=1 Tax=Pseudactinotalea suaedae TaxID=1524924 RepID=UPI0019D5A61F|nr:EF-Tu/IF-2/RF-3 family GTPase [Pseudactinotalea suaedae]
MTFYPDGETDIPNQTPVPGIRAGQVPPGRPDVPAGPAASRGTDPRFSKAIVRTGMINGVVLVGAVLLAYVFPITHDEPYAMLIVLGAAMLAGVHMTVVILAHQRRRRREKAMTAGVPSAYGEVPPVADAAPYGAVPAATAGGFALTVEDVFSITGRGTVVTGRVGSGQLRAGQYVVIRRGTQTLAEVEVTGIEMFRKTTDVASVGDNVGLLLKGVSRSDVQRGDVLSA